MDELHQGLPEAVVRPVERTPVLLPVSHCSRAHVCTHPQQAYSRAYSCHRTQEEMAHTCRGTINLAGAFIDAVDSTHFVITNGPSQVFHLRALNEIERQRWVTALELAKNTAIKRLDGTFRDPRGLGCMLREALVAFPLPPEDSDSEEETVENNPDTNPNPVAQVTAKLQELSTAHDLVMKNGSAILRVIGDVEGNHVPNESKLKEKLAMFKLTAGAMMKVGPDQ